MDRSPGKPKLKPALVVVGPFNFVKDISAKTLLPEPTEAELVALLGVVDGTTVGTKVRVWHTIGHIPTA